MKHALASVLLALILFPSIAMGVTVKYEVLVKLEGLHYYKFIGEPFTGKIKGNPRGSFKEGKRYGSWVGYYDSGQLKFKVNVKDGKRHGSSVGYHKNGLLASKGTYKNG